MIEDFRRVYAQPEPALTPDQASGSDALAVYQRRAHALELEMRRSVAGRGLDGAGLLADSATAGDNVAAIFSARGVRVPEALQVRVTAAARRRADAYGARFGQPTADSDVWDPAHLENRITVGAADGTRLVADDCPGGDLDWFSFDLADTEQPELAASGERHFKAFIPTPVRFAGMPNVRWWELEDRRVSFGLTQTSKTDLVKLLLAEFDLVYANDWYIVPLQSSVGGLVDVDGIVVTDNFGFNTWVEATARRQEERAVAGTWRLWA